MTADVITDASAGAAREDSLDDLSATTIHIATLAIDRLYPADWRRLESILDQAERTRAARYRFAADRQAFIAAHGLVRFLLSARRGVAPDAWQFAAGSFGKPMITGPRLESKCQFSLTHTRRRVAAAVYQGNREIALGLDLEAVGQQTSDLAIADAFFAPTERAQLLAITDPDLRQEHFIALWTLKESVIKATGLGLSQPLADFACDFDPIRVRFQDSQSFRGYWHFRQWRPDTNHFMALAVCWPQADPPGIRERSFDSGSLDPIL
ncbi:hypothetical protein CCR95_22245 [Thiocystis minor]|uniref:4'-phosphopantetheinyl transferase family protein n=1 Tax=Thiocystis minor TaxID=61597 RepID=UPI001911DD62|nr:4'-phosphopantetheinyl transferase superfamily protein [Thiocystis minor]MBK5966722.1 hypothetical protein [Thiocystis minor]